MVQNKRVGNKKAQITIFIILAIAIVVVALFLFVGRDGLINLISGKGPVEQIKDCVQKPFEESIETLSGQGGNLEPTNYYLYQGGRVGYLCYTEEPYKRCVMQKPLLKQSIEKELENYIHPLVQSCIDGVKSSLQEDGYTVSSKPVEVDVSLIPNSILLDMNADLRLEKEGSEFYETITLDINSKLYELIMISSSISNWEARYGESESTIYMGYYPWLRVEKKKQSEGTTVYTLTERSSEDKFRFAIRSVAIPPGIPRP